MLLGDIVLHTAAEGLTQWRGDHMQAPAPAPAPAPKVEKWDSDSDSDESDEEDLKQ